MMGETPALVARDLRKSYGPRNALAGLSFSLPAGHVLGLLGPNGAGKTTAIRILTTILDPTSGDFSVDGVGSDRPEQIRRRIGVLPESLGFPRQITALEFLSYFGQLYGANAAAARSNALSLLNEVGLERRARSPIESYSRGMRQRLGIARSLLNDPAVVFLDEPTLGLDPRGQEDLLQIIHGIARDRKVGVVLCSHLLSEVEAICDEVVILRTGQVVASGTVSEIVGQGPGTGTRVRVPATLLEQARRVLEAAPQLARVTGNSLNSGWLLVESTGSSQADGPEGPERGNRILEALIQANIPILGFETEGGHLQDAFLHLTGDRQATGYSAN